MKYYKKVELECLDLIKEHCINFIDKLGFGPELKELKTFYMTFPDHLHNMLETELMEKYNFPKIWYVRIYLRPKGTVQAIHVDGDIEIIHAALNIPLKGGENGFHTWHSGDYEMVRYYSERTFQHFFILKWKDKPKYHDSVEMIDGSYLVRVDAPHQAIASEDHDRWVMTIRFEGNPTYEQLYNQIP